MKSLSLSLLEIGEYFFKFLFLFSIGLFCLSLLSVSGLSNKQTNRPCWNLTDVTLADKETNLILTDKVNRVIQGNVAMQVTQPGGQPSNFGSDVTWWPNFDPICNKSEDAYLNEIQIRFQEISQIWWHQVTKFGTNASGAIWWPNL